LNTDTKKPQPLYKRLLKAWQIMK